MASTSLSVGDKVFLFNNKMVVAYGKILSTNPNDMCHGVAVGQGKVKVQVVEAVDPTCALPFMSMGADTIGEAVDSCVRWDIDYLQGLPKAKSSGAEKVVATDGNQDVLTSSIPLVTTTTTASLSGKGNIVLEQNLDHANDLGESSHHMEIVLYNSDSFHAEDEVPNPSTEKEKVDEDLDFYKHRKNWENLLVTILSKEDNQEIARGFIFLPFSNSYIEHVAVGEDHAGVMVMELCSGVDGGLARKHLPNFIEDAPLLTRWPILHLRISNNNFILGDLYHAWQENFPHEDADDIEGPGATLMLGESSRKKRSYHSTKRTKVDPELKLQRERQKKASKHTTEEAVVKALKDACHCPQNCGNTVRKDIVMEERRLYYGMSHERRLEYIYSQFEVELLDLGWLRFHGQTVCKDAFHSFYGFSKSTLYNYIKEWKDGARIGFHGNKGTVKTLSTTKMAHAFLHHFLVSTGEVMPHLVWTSGNGTDNHQYRLPSCYSKKEVFEEIKQKMVEMKVEMISDTSFYKLWRDKFANYRPHTTSSFARCPTCLELKRKLSKERKHGTRSELEYQREKHLATQASARNQYYAHNHLALINPEEHMSIIHDKMDQGKTTIPLLPEKLKSLQGQPQPLPLTLTGMLLHGYGPSKMGHVAIGGLWPSDPNFTVTSLAKMMRDCESYTGCKKGDLGFNRVPKHELFKTVLNEEVFEITFLKEKKRNKEEFFAQQGTHYQQEGTTFNCLPKKLFLQLDNSGKDNKNSTVMAFCSELVARGCFETVTMSFLNVGHTHEDVDAFFSRCNLALVRKHVASLPAFMAEVYDAERVKAMVSLIQEVADYKTYLKEYVEKITGQSAPVQFRFLMRDNIPIYQVRESYEGAWIPEHGRTLWKRADPLSKTDFLVVLPQGQPRVVAMSSTHAKKNEIRLFIRNYVRHLQEIRGENEDDEETNYLIPYWEAISQLFENGWSTMDGDELEGAFWPRTNRGTGYKKCSNDTSTSPIQDDVLQREFEEEVRDRGELFVGNPRDKTLENFSPLIDIKPLWMVLIRPSEDFVVQHCLWVVKALAEVNREAGSTHFNKVNVEWWRPVHKKSDASDVERYTDCISNNKDWEKDPTYIESDWIEASSTIGTWLSRSKGRKLKIPERTRVLALDFLEVVKELP